MSKINLNYFLYGAIVVTDLAWVCIGVLVLLIYIIGIGAVGLPYDNRIFLVLFPLPWGH